MAENPPQISVVIPLYNAERYIGEALDSILAQSFHDFEVIVVNDDSTDAGPSIVRDYAGRDRRISMVTQENRGLAGARNTGIRHARGTYIALLDADDAFEPDKLARHFAHLESRPQVGVSFAASRFMDDDSQLMRAVQQPKLMAITPEHIFCRNPVGNGSAAVLRRAMLADLTFQPPDMHHDDLCWFDETFRQSEDIEMWCRIAVTTDWRFEGIAGVLTRYRVNTSGLSADVEQQFASWQRFKSKLATLAPALVERYGAQAEAFQRRYLARRAALAGDGRKALRLGLGAVAVSPSILITEPKRTVATLILGTLATVLPRVAFDRVKEAALTPVKLPTPA